MLLCVPFVAAAAAFKKPHIAIARSMTIAQHSNQALFEHSCVCCDLSQRASASPLAAPAHPGRSYRVVFLTQQQQQHLHHTFDMVMMMLMI
jgi:hypothetical protein